jgi:hypothetical protein
VTVYPIKRRLSTRKKIATERGTRVIALTLQGKQATEARRKSQQPMPQ